MTRCVPGDLAVVIAADFPANLGRFVRVVRPDFDDTDIVFPAEEGWVWWVKSASPMTWRARDRILQRMAGPVPDSRLWPIRGELSLQDILDLDLLED